MNTFLNTVICRRPTDNREVKNKRNEIAPCGACGLSRKLFAKAHQAKASCDDDQKIYSRKLFFIETDLYDLSDGWRVMA